MALQDQIEALRQKRRAQLDQILSRAQPQQGQMNFQPVGLPQAQGSRIMSLLLGGLNAPGAQPTAPMQTAPASSQSFEIPKGLEGPARAAPGAKPLSPLSKPPEPTVLQKAGSFVSDAVKNTALYKAIAALFL